MRVILLDDREEESMWNDVWIEEAVRLLSSGAFQAHGTAECTTVIAHASYF